VAEMMNEYELELQELFRELEEDISRLSSMVRSVRSDIALKNDWRAKNVLETLAILNQRIGADLFRIYSIVERRANGGVKG
jgi:sugar-specific transcriptional regulator TrmB